MHSVANELGTSAEAPAVDELAEARIKLDDAKRELEAMCATPGTVTAKLAAANIAVLDVVRKLI